MKATDMKELLDTKKKKEMDKKLALEFPKLAELANELSETPAFDGWFNDFSRKVFESNLSREFYETYERDLAALPDEVWNSFKAKIIQQKNSHRRELLSLLNEAAGYGKLKLILANRGIDYDTIREPAEVGTKKKKGKSPEWVAYLDGKTIGALEVKTIFNSDEQYRYIEDNDQRIRDGGQPQTKNLHPHIPTSLLKKIDDVVGKAKVQLKEENSQSQLLVVFVIVNIDIETAQARNCKMVLENHLQNLNDKEILVIGDLRTPYF